MLLKLGRLDHVSNDISANKAIILAVAASGGSLAISDALCARLGDLIWARGRDYLPGQDFGIQTNGHRTLPAPGSCSTFSCGPSPDGLRKHDQK